MKKIWKTLKVQVKLILNCPRVLAITCLSHKRQNIEATFFIFCPQLSKKLS